MQQVVAPQAGRFRNGRIGEMPRIANSRAILFGTHLAIELGGEALEIGNHPAGLRDLAPACRNFKILRRDCAASGSIEPSG